MFTAVATAIFLIILGTTLSITSTYLDLGFVGVLPIAISIATILTEYQRGKFNREEYRINFQDGFHMERGSWFTAETVDVSGKKVTDIELRLPFIRHTLFGTGDIFIETAGSGGSEIRLRDVSNPRKVFGEVQEVLQESGHELSDETAHRRARPTRRGALFGALGQVGSLLGFLLVLAGNLLFLLSGLGLLLGVTSIIVLLGVVGAWTYLDRRRRTYSLFDDRVELEEGWLTRHHKIIPAEKLSDSKTQQGLFDRILGLHTVVLSSKGSGGEFRLLHLSNAMELQNSVDQIESSLSELENYEESLSNRESGSGSNDDATGDKWSLNPSLSRAVTPWIILGVLSVVGTILSVVFPPLAIAVWVAMGSFAMGVFNTVVYLHTTYEVTDDSVMSSFDFIISNRTHFSFEKVTGVVERRSPLDYMFGTKQLVFWSIGSDSTLRMRHLDVASSTVDDILTKHGVSYDNNVDSFTPSFDIKSFIFGLLPVHIPVLLAVGASTVFTPLGLVATAGTVVLYALVIVYATFYYQRAHVDLFDTCLRVTRGIFYRTTHHLVLDDIKNVSSTKYPLVSAGSITFNAAGERVVQTNNGKQSLPYQTGVRFIADVRDIHGRVDAALLGLDPEGVDTSQTVTGQPSLRNLFLLAGVLLPLTAVFVWTLPYFVWRRRCMWYGLSDHHVLARNGIFYKEKTTVRYAKIDHVNTVRGWRNKACGNSSINIETTGSSSPEIVVKDVKNAGAFQDGINDHRDSQTDG